MWSILIICLSLTSYIHGELDDSVDRAVAEIASSCLTDQEHVKLSGNLLGPAHARLFNSDIVNHALSIIAHEEMRAVLRFAKPGPWTHYKQPTMMEWYNANLEQYFGFMTQDKEISLDSKRFLEKNFPPVIAFLDERFPEIRQIFSSKFKDFIRNNMKESIDLNLLNELLYEYRANIKPKLDDAIRNVFMNMKCMKGLF